MVRTKDAQAPSHPPRPRGPRPPRPQAYDRRSELPRVLPVLRPEELDDESPLGRRRVLAKLRSALRAERRRGIAGHWSYDLARHAELLRIYRLELALCGLPDPTRARAPLARRLNAARRC